MDFTEFQFITTTKGRIDSIVSKEMDFSRNRVKKMLDDGFVFVNDICCQNASFRISGGERIKVVLPTVTNHLEAEEAELEILYKDADIAVVVKPAGLTVHPCPSCEESTLVHQLLHHFPELRALEGERPGIVHRLDKDTSGLMIIALHEEARLRLVEAFAQRRINKTYLALVSGQCEKGESQESLGRHPTYKTKMAQVPLEKGGREAYSTWERIFPPTFEEAVTKQGKSVPVPKTLQSSFSLMAVKIYTGRTHQIRVHLSEAGFPLLGDSTYAFGANAHIAQSAPRQMLHAWKLHFYHPMTEEELSFTCPLPEDFMETISILWHKELAFQKLIITGCSGTGKSALLEAFQKHNVPIFSADTCVQELYKPHADGWYLLKNQYGQRFVNYTTEEERKNANIEIEGERRGAISKTSHSDIPLIDKKALFSAMKDSNMRREIENIVHPLIFTRLGEFFKNAQGSWQKDEENNTYVEALETRTDVGIGKKHFCYFAAAEIPLWFESRAQEKEQSNTDCIVICVTCDEKERYDRLKKRGWTEEVIATMDSWQWAQEDKAQNAQYVIENTNDVESLEQKSKEILRGVAKEQKALLEKKLRILQKNMNAYENSTFADNTLF